MDITYLGHSSFKLRGKHATAVTDPFDKNMVGFEMPRVSADIVTISHDHKDHNQASQISDTARREEPYVVAAPGEYEVSGIGVFGWKSYHDDKKGEERGRNVISVIHVDGVRVAHLGDLGHMLNESFVDNLGEVDVLLVPVGGKYTIDAKTAKKVVELIQPGYVIPMHYKTKDHDEKTFGELAPVEEFLREMNVDGLEPEEKLRIEETDIPEETEVVLLKR